MIDNEITGTPCSNDVAYSDPIQISNDPYNSENDYSVLCEEYNPEGNFTSSVEAACAREHCRVDAYFLREFNENESTLDVVIFAIIVLKLGYFPLYNKKPSTGLKITFRRF